MNQLSAPAVKSPPRKRTLHAAMDRAVLDAYGWHNIPTACEFLLDYEDEDENEEAADASTISNPQPERSGDGRRQSTIRRRRKKPYRYRWPDEVRDEVLAKLLALNAQRAEQEKLSGSTGKKSAKKTTATPKGTLKQSIMQRPKAEDELI